MKLSESQIWQRKQAGINEADTRKSAEKFAKQFKKILDDKFDNDLSKKSGDMIRIETNNRGRGQLLGGRNFIIVNYDRKTKKGFSTSVYGDLSFEEDGTGKVSFGNEKRMKDIKLDINSSPEDIYKKLVKETLKIDES